MVKIKMTKIGIQEDKFTNEMSHPVGNTAGHPWQGHNRPLTKKPWSKLENRGELQKVAGK